MRTTKVVVRMLAHHQLMVEAVREAAEEAGRLRRELAESQSKIRCDVASCVPSLGKVTIEGLLELPADVKAEVERRDGLRAQHSEELKASQAALLRAGNEFAGSVVEAW